MTSILVTNTMTALKRLVSLARSISTLASRHHPEAPILTAVERFVLVARFLPTLARCHDPEASILTAVE